MPKYFLVAKNGQEARSSRAFSASDVRALKSAPDCYTFIGELTNKAKNVGACRTLGNGPGATWKAPKRRPPKPPKRDRNWRKKLVEKYPSSAEFKKYAGLKGAPAWWPFGHKKAKPAARHPMTRTVYYARTASGTYKPVDRPPSHAMAGARRKRKRRR